MYSHGLPLVMPIISCFQSYGFLVNTLTESEGILPAEATVTCDPFPPPQTTMDCWGSIIIKNKKIKNYSDTGD